MFGRKKRKQSPVLRHFDTLISRKTQIEGDLYFSGGLHIDGSVRGTVRAKEGSEGVVRISDIGVVHGDVFAPHIIVNGKVNGNVHASKHLELAPKASIAGNVHYHLIEMAMGAEVNGKLVHEMPKPETAAQAAPQAEASQDGAKREVSGSAVPKTEAAAEDAVVAATVQSAPRKAASAPLTSSSEAVSSVARELAAAVEEGAKERGQAVSSREQVALKAVAKPKLK